jgi:hypothetical protein
VRIVGLVGSVALNQNPVCAGCLQGALQGEVPEHDAEDNGYVLSVNCDNWQRGVSRRNQHALFILANDGDLGRNVDIVGIVPAGDEDCPARPACGCRCHRGMNRGVGTESDNLNAN